MPFQSEAQKAYLKKHKPDVYQTLMEEQVFLESGTHNLELPPLPERAPPPRPKKQHLGKLTRGENPLGKPLQRKRQTRLL